jgi:hypothetical protein
VSFFFELEDVLVKILANPSQLTESDARIASNVSADYSKPSWMIEELRSIHSTSVFKAIWLKFRLFKLRLLNHESYWKNSHMSLIATSPILGLLSRIRVLIPSKM